MARKIKLSEIGDSTGGLLTADRILATDSNGVAVTLTEAEFLTAFPGIGGSSATGTDSNTFDIDADAADFVRLTNSSGILDVRDDQDALTRVNALSFGVNGLIVKNVSNDFHLLESDDLTFATLRVGELQTTNLVTVTESTLQVEDAEVKLRSQATAIAATDAFIKVERGTSGHNASIKWDETSKKWQAMELDGSGNEVAYRNILSVLDIYDNLDGNGFTTLALSANQGYQLSQSLAGKINASLLTAAEQIIVSTGSATPSAVTVNEATLVGRLTGGSVVGLTRTQVEGILPIKQRTVRHVVTAGNVTDKYITLAKAPTYPESVFIRTESGAEQINQALNSADHDYMVSSTQPTRVYIRQDVTDANSANFSDLIVAGDVLVITYNAVE